MRVERFSLSIGSYSSRLWAVQCGCAISRPDKLKLSLSLGCKILLSFGLPETTQANLVQKCLHLTRTVMPELAKASKSHWPVRNDHCFQRIVLDTICGGVWYDHIARANYKHLGDIQTTLAVRLCQQIIVGQVDLAVLKVSIGAHPGGTAEHHLLSLAQRLSR